MVDGSLFLAGSSPSRNAESLVDLLRMRVQLEPDKIFYRFLQEADTAESSFTSAELDRRARAVAALLQSSGLRPGDRVLLLYPQGPDYVAAFFGCLYARMTAIPVYPPRMNKPMLRLQAILEDAQPSAALTLASVLTPLQAHFPQAPALASLRWLTTDTLPAGTEDDWRRPLVTRDHLALLQYTSGSTSAPKGVMLTHGNVLENMAMARACFDSGPNTRGVSWLPLYHDMGLMGGVVMPLYGGVPATLMSALSFLQQPIRWLQAISDTRATHSGGPTFGYDLCLRRISAEQRSRLDLSHWRVAFVGAEPVRHETLRQFANIFGPCGFRWEAFCPCYGLAEATVFATGCSYRTPPVVLPVEAVALEQNRVVEAPPECEGTRLLVGCGRPLMDGKVMIVDPQAQTPCPPGQVGEIWVAGPNVGLGYWNRQEQTACTFQAYLADTGKGPFLRTGDLGFVKDGELFVTGRSKDLLIIRGKNHYPHDIEVTVEKSHAALRPNSGAAFAVDVSGEERLVVVQELERHGRDLDRGELVRTIRQAVAEGHELQTHAVVLIKPASIPRTSSGKIQRQACRANFLSGSLEEWVK